MPGAGPIVLGLETSCDETSAAVLGADHQILGHVILSQDVHEVYGGVVPELAARAHLQKVDSVVAACLERAPAPPGSPATPPKPRPRSGTSCPPTRSPHHTAEARWRSTESCRGSS